MGLGHGHEPALEYLKLPSGVVRHECFPAQQGPLEVQGAPLAAERQAAAGPPRTVAHPDIQRQPVRDVNHVLIHGFYALDDARDAVVDARKVAAGIMGVPRAVFRGGAAGGEVAVAERGQRLPVPFVGGIETLVHQQPRVRNDQPDVQFADVFNHDVGARGFQRSPPPGPVEADHEPESPTSPGFHAGCGVRDHHGPGGGDLQPAHGFEDQSRRRHSGDIVVQGRLAIHDVVKDLAKARGGHDRGGVPAGGGEDHGDPPGPEPLKQRHGAGENGHGPAREHGFENSVLALRESERRPLVRAVRGRAAGNGDPARGQECGHAVLPGPALDPACEVIVREGRAPRVSGKPGVRHDVVKELFPSCRAELAGIGHDAVEVKDHGIDGSQRGGNCGRLRHGPVLSAISAPRQWRSARP
ncbi:hypothetical protein SRABI128_05350 [Microbacterium sp. Bi128]|nr:hypothetical protein SRABI128_05350 [Microbacterium sp. Bi128]